MKPQLRRLLPGIEARLSSSLEEAEKMDVERQRRIEAGGSPELTEEEQEQMTALWLRSQAKATP